MKIRYLLAALGAAVACSLGSVSIAQADDTITLKMAHQWPDDPNDYVVSTGKKFAQEVMQRSGGKIHIDIFPAESLVKALNMHTALRSGNVDLAIYPYIYAAGAIPQMNLILLPGLWKTPDDVYRFRTSAPWRELEARWKPTASRRCAGSRSPAVWRQSPNRSMCPATSRNRRCGAPAR